MSNPARGRVRPGPRHGILITPLLLAPVFLAPLLIAAPAFAADNVICVLCGHDPVVRSN
jgi:hypothetical protein